MNFDWFLLLTPILLLPLWLLLFFTGCGEVVKKDHDLTFILHDDLSISEVNKVKFYWIIDGMEQDPVSVDVYKDTAGVREFRYQPEGEQFGQAWKVTCKPFFDEIGFGEISCGPFELDSPMISVQFEIVADPQGGGRVQVRQGHCPGPTSLL